jgi:hypothetical protein
MILFNLQLNVTTVKFILKIVNIIYVRLSPL